MLRTTAAILFVGFVVLGCADDYEFHNYPEFASAVGVARMSWTGAITIQFPAVISPRDFEVGTETIKPGEPRYENMRHCLGLRPGQIKALYDPPAPCPQISN